VGPRSRRLSTKQALLHMRRSLHLARAPIRGAKLMLDQLELYRLSLDALDAAFSRPKYIVLYRQSLAEQYLSRKSAKATDQWILLKDQDRKQVRVLVDPVELRQYCETVKQSYRKILEHRWLAERAVLVSYEELTADPHGWLGGHIAPLLGVPPGQLATTLRKQNTSPIAERVANYGEVAALLASPLCQQRYVWPWRKSTERHAGARRAA
jgi:LPS sulfotransferase NodH